MQNFPWSEVSADWNTERKREQGQTALKHERSALPGMGSLWEQSARVQILAPPSINSVTLHKLCDLSEPWMPLTLNKDISVYFIRIL